jgi:hypothetical protein
VHEDVYEKSVSVMVVDDGRESDEQHTYCIYFILRPSSFILHLSYLVGINV